MAKFTIVITGRGKFPHVDCFLEMAKATAAALRALGHEVTDERDPGRLIVFGANNLFDPTGQMPMDTIIFNSEQLAAVADPTYFLQGYLKDRNVTVWDYSAANVKVLNKLGLKGVHCPIGYTPAMTTIENLPAAEQDIDVLYYGSVGQSRRREILDALDATGMNVCRLFNVYGAERDSYVARSKVVINLHYYERGVFEIFRVSHLLANKKCVVTEAGGCDPQLEEFAQKSCEYVERARFVDTCKELVASESMRDFVAQRGFDAFKQIDFVESVRKALEASS